MLVQSYASIKGALILFSRRFHPNKSHSISLFCQLLGMLHKSLLMYDQILKYFFKCGRLVCATQIKLIFMSIFNLELIVCTRRFLVMYIIVAIFVFVTKLIQHMSLSISPSSL